APVQTHAAARMPRLGIRQELQDRERGDRLARAALADQRERLALVDVERHPAHRLERAPLDLEVDRQILHFEQAHGAPTQRKVLRGSKASRTASPMKISSDSITAITTKPLMPSQGAWRLFLPWASRSPSEGDPGGRPKPRKSSEVRATMEPIRMNGMNVTVATMALGRMCRSMMVILPTPSARAARTKSKLRARRNSARTTPTNAVQLNSSKRPSSHQKLGVTTLARIISMNSVGMEFQISMKRWNTGSTQPP